MSEADSAQQKALSPEWHTFEWKPGMCLPAGTVFQLSHEKHPLTYTFISHDLDGTNEYQGVLFVERGEEILERHEARISLLHPAGFLAQNHVPHVRFFYTESGKSTAITPAFDTARHYFDKDIAAEVQLEALEKQLRAPFADQESQSVIEALVRYLRFKAQAAKAGETYRQAADVLETDFVND